MKGILDIKSGIPDEDLDKFKETFKECIKGPKDHFKTPIIKSVSKEDIESLKSALSVGGVVGAALTVESLDETLKGIKFDSIGETFGVTRSEGETDVELRERIMGIVTATGSSVKGIDIEPEGPNENFIEGMEELAAK